MNVPVRAVVVVTALLTFAPASFAGPVERRIAAVTRAVDKAEPADPSGRLKAVSEPLLGTPYGASPLGEAFAPAADPRVRFDAADCLPFVETALALTAARTMDDLRPLLDDIRYGDGRPSFEGRNHFVESQWIPRNVAKGWLRPASREVAGPEVVRASKLFGPEQFARRHREIDGREDGPPVIVLAQALCGRDDHAASPQRIPQRVDGRAGAGWTR